MIYAFVVAVPVVVRWPLIPVTPGPDLLLIPPVTPLLHSRDYTPAVPVCSRRYVPRCSIRCCSTFRLLFPITVVRSLLRC